MRVQGTVSSDGNPLAEGALVDGQHWLELPAGAELNLRHTSTSREYQLLGPARVLPCRKGSELVLLASGRISTSANLGVRPGAEVMIATPAGLIRYGDAALDIELDAKGLSLRVKQGEAWVESETAGKPPFSNPLKGGKELHLPASRITPSARVATCQASAATAKTSAERVAAGKGDADAGAGSLGDRAAAQMRDRRKARADCAVASAAIATLDDAAEKSRLSESVAHAEQLWQTVPRFTSGRNR
jgi:hypothetical protein